MGALFLVLIVAGTVHVARGWRVLPNGALGGPSQAVGWRWQFGVADLLMWTFVAALMILARNPLWEGRHLLWTADDSYGIVRGVRCGSVLCVAIGMTGMQLLLTDRPRVAWFLAISTLAVGLAVLVARQPLFAGLRYGLRDFVPGGLGATLATLATLLSLRAYGWRATWSELKKQEAA